MANRVPAEHVAVLIAGAGPIGLALACELGRRGVRTLLVEREPDRMGSAKMIVVSVRTMEFCRQLGIAPHVRDWGFPLDYALDSVFVTNLQGFELGRVRTPALSVDADTPFSPERERPCPQTWFDPILQRHARSFGNVELRYHTALEGFTQDEHGVTVDLANGNTGERETVRADYVVGCDGYTSTVRTLLGIELRGERHLDLSMSVYVRIKNLPAHHSMGDAYRYVFLGEEGVWSVLTTIDGHDLWRVQLIGANEIDVRSHDLDQVMRRCIGANIDYTIEDVSYWVRKMTVADRFSDGRVFIAGDAAHAHPPNGGLGMNTGIQDAWDLGWKLAGMVQGWGGPLLPASYDIERRPASSRAASESLRNYHRLVAKTRYPQINDASPEGERLRAELGARLVADNEKAWHPIGVHLGYLYHPSPIVVDDGSPVPADDTVSYEPSARPGARAPHAWLTQTQSTLDLLGPGFSLLRFIGCDTTVIEAAARERGLPLAVHDIRDPAVHALYERDLVLVRPDGHVAWRDNALPRNSLELIDQIRGAGRNTASARRPAIV